MLSILVLAAVFVPQANEKWYDLGGSLGFLSTTFISLYYPTLKVKYWEGINIPFPPLSSFAPRQLLLTSALIIWTTRLGSFLVQVSATLLFLSVPRGLLCHLLFPVQRAIKAGGDSRFDQVKHQAGTFTAFWMAQGVFADSGPLLYVSHTTPAASWVFFVGMPVYLVRLASRAFLALSNVSLSQVNIVPANLHPALTCRDYASLGLFAGSLLFEIIADCQKSAWRHAKKNKDHEEKFITSGLWSISRHPKYHLYFHVEVGAGPDNSFSAMSVK